MRRRRVFVVLWLAVALALVASSCGDTGAEVGTAPRGAGSDFTLYVSNQSFEDPAVQFTITLDGTVVIDQIFRVGNQHSWIAFGPELPPGDHTLTAVSSTGTELAVEFSSEAGQPIWALLEYWWNPEGEPRHFTFEISDVGFHFF